MLAPRIQPATVDSASPLQRRIAWGVFIAWFAATSVFGAWTVAQHLIPLPNARPNEQAAGNAPLAWYVLGSDCGCSASVAGDLVKRGPQRDWREQVWLVGDEPEIESRLRQVGFSVARIAPEELARTHRIHGAPWLALFDRGGQLTYSGGYARSRPGLPGAFNVSFELMTAVARGQPVENLPSYGCATSEALRERLDPLHLRFPAKP